MRRRAVREGTTFRYSLSERARVKFTIAERRGGYKRVGSFVQKSSRGRNAKRFSGRIDGHRLRPGVYRARLTARDAAGNTSPPRFLRFRVVG